MVEMSSKEGGRLWDTKWDETVFLCALCFAAVLAMALNSFQLWGGDTVDSRRTTDGRLWLKSY